MSFHPATQAPVGKAASSFLQSVPSKESDEKRTASNGQRGHHEDLLERTWRSLASSVVLASNKADKLAGDPTNGQSKKELDEALVGFLRKKLEWGRIISFLEAKLEGKAKEMEILQHFNRTQATAGISRKRKRDDAQASSEQR